MLMPKIPSFSWFSSSSTGVLFLSTDSLISRSRFGLFPPDATLPGHRRCPRVTPIQCARFRDRGEFREARERSLEQRARRLAEAAAELGRRERAEDVGEDLRAGQ